MMELFIFRHGETDWNAQGRFQGHIDIPLNSRGREQARALVEKLQSKGIEAILSSDLSRAVETAQIVAAELKVPVFIDSALREAYLGAAQGMTYQEILEQFGEDITGRWRSSQPTDADVSYPGGETATQVIERVFGALERFMETQTNLVRIGVSCHGGVIRRVMQRLRPPGSDPVRIPNTVLYQIGFDPQMKKWHLYGE
ncbi:histidine phosphatase family protein [Bdellovibrionota bacterium FG-1]